MSNVTHFPSHGCTCDVLLIITPSTLCTNDYNNYNYQSNESKNNIQTVNHSVFRFLDIKAFYTPTAHSVSARTPFWTNKVFIRRVRFLANMKSYLAACFVVVAMSTFAILGNAQSIAPPVPVTVRPALIKPTTANPHNCDCKGECKKVQHGQVPFKDEVGQHEF